MSDVLTEVTTRLATAVSGVEGTDVFYGELPPSPDVVSVARPTGGMSGVKVLGTAGYAYQRPTLMFQFRATPGDLITAYANAWLAFLDLTTIEAEDLSSTRYDMVTALAEPSLLGNDENNRPVVFFSMNFTKEPS